MATIGKLVERMRNNPAGGWTFEDVYRVLTWYGCTCRPPSSGSHYKFTHAKVPDKILTIPRHNPLKPVYVIEAIDMVDRIEEVEGID